MTENDKQTEEGEGRELKFSFRLSKEEKADLELVAKKLAMGNKTNFIIQAVQKFKDHPEQWNFLDSSVIETITNKVDELTEKVDKNLEKTEESIETNLKTLEIVYQMQSLRAHQEENSHTADLQENIKTSLLNYENLSELNTYKSVEEFLTKEFPDKEKEVIEDKIYNEILLELMQEGHLKYNVRSKMLKWSEK